MWFDLTNIVRDDLLILSISVALVKLVRALGPFLHKSPGAFVRCDYAVFCPCFNGHVGHGQPLIHGELRNDRTGELHGPVTSTVNANLADGIKNQILASNPGTQIPLEDKLDGGRHAEPGPAGYHNRSKIRTANAGGKGTEPPVSTSVAVGPHYHISGEDQSLFRQERVFDAHATHLIKMG